MARVLGYGGVANTNGARDFTGKEEAEIVIVPPSTGGSYAKYYTRSRRAWILLAFLFEHFLRRFHS